MHQTKRKQPKLLLKKNKTKKKKDDKNVEKIDSKTSLSQKINITTLSDKTMIAPPSFSKPTLALSSTKPTFNLSSRDKPTLDLISASKPILALSSTEPTLALSSAEPFLKVEKVEKDLKKSPQHTISMSQQKIRYNEKFIELMEKLASIMVKHGEPFRARAYQKAQETIMMHKDDITSPEDLKGKSNIGTTIMEKLNEYLETGTLKVLEREKNNPVNILTDVYGIGPKKAQELVEKGITSIEQLRENQQLLNDVQKVGLQYYEDVLKRIPRKEIDEYKEIIENIVKKIAIEQTEFSVVGSYRRGHETSGDIDMIITSKTEQTFKNIIDELIKQKIIVSVLSRGSSKCLVMAKIPSSTTIRRVDFLFTTPVEYPFAVLYFTGSKIFNTMMRHHALQMGLTMNEHGLYKMIEKTKSEKVSHHFESEKDIFDYLNLEYKSPKERIDGRQFIKKTKKKIIIEEEDDEEEEDDLALSSAEPFLKVEKEEELINILNNAKLQYYNFQPIMTDNEFDTLQDYVTSKYPNNPALKQIGAPPPNKNKVILPYFMGSMDKIKPNTTALKTWSSKYQGPYVLSCKLDGVSGLYTTEGPSPKLYTRGDGKVGQDISYLIPHLRLPKTKGVVIRGEFIIPKATFEIKYATKFANPRNMVAGIINQKSVNDSIKDVDFVSYELIKPLVKPSEQMVALQNLNINVVQNMISSQLTNELLSDTLINWRQSYPYEIDGIIVTNDETYPERKDGNPEHAFAFKMVLSDQIAEAKVVDIIWTPSKDGYLKPRVQIEPINLGGVKIEYVTGFNGAFIQDNKLGIGAMIELIRSGDVIPHIRKVIVPATQAKMPDVPFIWNDTHVDILVENIDTDEIVKEKNITGFFKGIEVEGLSSGNISRIIQTGFDSVSKILQMTIPDFLKVEGFKEKTAQKLYTNIHEKIQSAPLVSIMAASNIFGRGFNNKKLELILESYPDVLQSQDVNKIAKVAAIKGMALKTAEAFIVKIPAFLAFVIEANLQDKLLQQTPQVKDQSHPLYNKSIVFTSFRDKQLEDKLKSLGVKLGSSVSKNTFVVLVKEKPIEGEETGKVLDAKKLNIPIMTAKEFISIHL